MGMEGVDEDDFSESTCSLVTIGGANDEDDRTKGLIYSQKSLIEELGRYASWLNPQNVIKKSLSHDSKSYSRFTCYNKKVDDRTLFEKMINCTNVTNVLDSDDESILRRKNATFQTNETNDILVCNVRSTQYSFEDTHVSNTNSVNDTNHSCSTHSKISLIET